MNVKQLISKYLLDVTPTMHKIRRLSLFAAIESTINGGVLSVTGLGRNMDTRKQHFLIRASIATQGRSLTLYEEIHPLSLKEKPKTHRLFMQKLKAMLPQNVTPVIVTDAGFRISQSLSPTNWMRLYSNYNSNSCEQDRSSLRGKVTAILFCRSAYLHIEG